MADTDGEVTEPAFTGSNITQEGVHLNVPHINEPGDDDIDQELAALVGDGTPGTGSIGTHVTQEEQEYDEHGNPVEPDELKEKLDGITVTPPTGVPTSNESLRIEESEIIKVDTNLPKEKLILSYADNFKRQYVQLYRDRKPLFLNPVNEYNCEKFVSTTIRPTLLPYKEFYSWDGCAVFVADYLNFKPLEIPHELPMRLVSPALVIKRQLGNCFEYSTTLASLLLAAGFDAYVVSGYATREVCFSDTTRQLCGLLKSSKEEQVEESKFENPKYQVKPPKDLRSKFILKMEARKKAEEEQQREKERLEEEKKQMELDKPLPDSLWGMRIHAWILILPGKREVPEGFFIEPFTGQSHVLDYENYHGIESIWNHENYWVNMQDCSNGVKDLVYDLGDATKWEFMLPGHDKALLTLPEIIHDEADLLDDEGEEEEVENYLDMPVSWADPIVLSEKDYQTRCPHGKKTILYKKAKVEKFAPYLMPDGITCRLSTYADRNLTEHLTTKEFFEHRVDKLVTKNHNLNTGLITEVFKPGRTLSLKEHIFKATAPERENDRTMEFFHAARVDGLSKRIETPSSIEENYEKRDDFLYYVLVQFQKRTNRFMPQDSMPYPRNILKMIQKFHRNPDKNANEDIAEIIFHVSEDRIHITYHLEDNRIAASTREFVKPHNWHEKGAMISLTSDMHITFQVSQDTKTTKQVDQFLMFLDLMKREQKCTEAIRESEEEVKEILDHRLFENEAQSLAISVYDTERNEKAKKHRQELERTMEEFKLRKQEMDLDYLAPFLAQMGHPTKLNRTQAYKLKEDCLSDLKQRLIDRANLIQARFEKETHELQKKQAWYQQNQMSMQKVDEEDYLNYCSEAMFRIHILELRLNRHKEMAPHKYMAMEQKLRSDPRLSEFF